MNQLQMESSEDSVSLRNKQVQFSFENDLDETEPFPISSPYESDIIEVFDNDSSDEENEEPALKFMKTFLKTYELEQGFSIRRKRSELFLEDGKQVLRKVSWECGCASKYQPKKRVNGNMPKSTLRILITVVNSHNHPLSPAPSITISNYHKLGEDMLEFIDFCVTHGTTGARNIEQLLKGKFPGQTIHKKNLYKAIQNAKKKLPLSNELDALNLLSYMYDLKTNDPRWFVEARFDGPERRLCSLIFLSPEQQVIWTRFHDIIFFDTTSRTNKYNMVACFFVATALLEDETEESFTWALRMINKCTSNLAPQVIYTDSDPAMSNAILTVFPGSLHCLCLFHINLNLKKNLRSKMNAVQFNEFLKDFYACRNTMVIDIFESKFESIKSKYTVAASYINRQLEPSKMKWAVCYINNQFTAGVNSTQRVESFNRKIHDSIKANSSLITLVKEIQDLLNQESEYACVEEYKHQVPMVGLATISKTFFNSLNSIVDEYLTEPISICARKQMQECFFYDTYKLDPADWKSIEKIHSNDDINDGAREDDYELAQILLSDILKTIENSKIIEIWRLTLSCSAKSQFVILISDGSH
ncbi:33622_t:CDS:2, partial [Gigaspora margarita]